MCVLRVLPRWVWVAAPRHHAALPAPWDPQRAVSLAPPGAAGGSAVRSTTALLSAALGMLILKEAVNLFFRQIYFACLLFMYHVLQKEMRFKPFILLQVRIVIMVTVNVRRNSRRCEDLQS